MEEDSGRDGESSSLKGDVVLASENVEISDHCATQKKVEALDEAYLELQVQEESLRSILEKLHKDQSCLEAGVRALEASGTKSDSIKKNKRSANVDNDVDEENEEEALRRLRQALMEESSCSGSENDDERVTTRAAGLGPSLEV
jgi:hypothetical protein